MTYVGQAVLNQCGKKRTYFSVSQATLRRNMGKKLENVSNEHVF